MSKNFEKQIEDHSNNNFDMELAELEKHIAVIAHDLVVLPPEDLILYASERGWLNASRTSAAFNLRLGTSGEPSRRRLLFEINLLIVTGYLRDRFPEGAS